MMYIDFVITLLADNLVLIMININVIAGNIILKVREVKYCYNSCKHFINLDFLKHLPQAWGRKLNLL